ncbi:hypothetical protein LOC54_06245 [Acetobacter sp. AN02]|nr:hypothetical protein [Acetobacter sp. AN02]MDG6094710.1 hypothetical protein [Acetobacter sp. AN02]
MRRFLLPAFLFLVSGSFCLQQAGAEESVSLSGSVAASGQLQKEMTVLRFNPDETSDSCIHALKEMHETQEKLEKLEDRTNDPDLAVARDVLESDYEAALEMCGPDARRMCEASPGKMADGLKKACADMRRGHEETSSE